jgi:hypothetical protein
MSPAGAELQGRLVLNDTPSGRGNELDRAERRRAFDDVFAADGIQIISTGTGSRLVSALPGDYIQTDALNHRNSGGQLPTPMTG